MCDSFLGEGKVGVDRSARPLPATSHSAAPLPEEGIKILPNTCGVITAPFARICCIIGKRIILPGGTVKTPTTG